MAQPQSENVSPEILKEDLSSKILLGKNLQDRLSNNSLKKVQGLPKLEKKVRQEVRFLERFLDEENFWKLKKEHITCSNLVHLASIINTIFKVENPSAVIQPFNLLDNDGNVVKKVVADIVCDKGRTWIKVVARNPKALDLNSLGGNQFGQRSILDQVKEFVRCASQNPIMFAPPQIKFVFANGVTQSLKKRVLKRGAVVEGETVLIDDMSGDESEESSEESDTEESDIEEGIEDVKSTESEVDTSKLNLDITAMIAYVSALTNGRNYFEFKEKILAEQASWERDRPAKPFLDSVFEGKELICCESAMRDFQSIVGTLAGAGERKRAAELVRKVRVVSDRDSERTRGLGGSGKIKDRSRLIFGTGDSLRVITVTANTGFIRAAQGQGVNFNVIIHESRALSEDKEKFAINADQKEPLP